MIEQYLYANFDSSDINNEESSCRVAKTQNITDDDTVRLDNFAKALEKSFHSSEKSFLAKYTVGKSGDFAVCMYSPFQGGRVSHQFLFNRETRTELISSPEEIFRLPFITALSPEKRSVLRSSDSLELTDTFKDILPFPELLKHFALDDKSFGKIISAAFDCRKNNRKILFITEKTFEKDFNALASLLYYIFRFLPYHMRMALGFDSRFSAITNRSQINISFALPSDLSLSGEGIYTVCGRECKNDYIVYNGRIIHSTTDETPSGAYLIPGILPYITDEYNGIDCSDKLHALFHNLYIYTSGIPAGYLNDILTYDAVFAAMDIVSKGSASRDEAEPLIRFYIASRKRLTRNEEFWDDAISCFVDCSSELPTDGWILSALSALYCKGSNSLKALPEQLKNRAVKLFEINNEASLVKFSELAENYDPDGVCGLATLLFTASSEISSACVSHLLSKCKSAYKVCCVADELCHILGESAYEKISETSLSMLGTFDIGGDDIDSIRKLSLSESSIDIRTVIGSIADEAMDKADYRGLPPAWFRQHNWSFDFLPQSVGGVTVFLIRDMLNDTALSAPGQYYANYAYVDKDVFSKASATARDAVLGMFLSGELALAVTFYSALCAAVSYDTECKYDELCRILSKYPSEIAGFTAYIGSITRVAASDEKSKSASFTKYLMKIEGTAIASVKHVNACELIASVNRTVKAGIKTKYAKTFNSRIYKAFSASKRGAAKGYYFVTRPLHMASARSVKNRELITACSVFVAFALAVLLLSLILFGGGVAKAEKATAEVFYYESQLATTEYDTDIIDDATLISDTDKTVYSTPLTGSFTVTASQNTASVYCKQQYMYSPDDRTLTSKEAFELTANEDGNYEFVLDTSGGYVYRVIITITVKSEDGVVTVYTTAIENYDYNRSLDEADE